MQQALAQQTSAAQQPVMRDNWQRQKYKINMPISPHTTFHRLHWLNTLTVKTTLEQKSTKSREL